MRWATAKTERVLEASQREAVDAALRACGGHARWRVSARAGRSYALLELPDECSNVAAARAAAAGGATAYDAPVIALAVFPTVAEALPPLLAALGGSGRPAGVRSCEPCSNGGVVVEWDLEITAATVVLALVDLELARFAAARITELLTPLLPAWTVRVAADGLRTPEISAGQVLETLLERAGLREPDGV